MQSFTLTNLPMQSPPFSFHVSPPLSTVFSMQSLRISNLDNDRFDGVDCVRYRTSVNSSNDSSSTCRDIHVDTASAPLSPSTSSTSSIIIFVIIMSPI
uniref:CUB domain-containing protein n=1 Tax=Caenorhabditis tropicalis TaxID=1561998 RepID=A0A1I7UP46_9PELO